ncbi:hypothetical protein COOONC_09189 [Cooperia oncophora]
MLMLFVVVSSTADDFFSPSVSSIVAHLKISESIAWINPRGVTFMAFGNGAPDIFGSIASVLSSPKPKAGLALGELLGYLGLYAVYIITVIVGHRLHKRRRKQQRENSLKKSLSNIMSRHGTTSCEAPMTPMMMDRREVTSL